MKKINLGYAMCGSFCTISKSLNALKGLKEYDINIIPIMSDIVYKTDTRFGKAEDIKKEVTDITKNDIIHTITEAEPIGPKKMLDVLVVAPLTGNTAAKIALGITDTPVTMAVKAHLRNGRPVVLGIATNDAFGASAKNIGLLQNTKNIYFVPYSQDDAQNKPTSLICDFSRIPETVEMALRGIQVKPMLV